MLRANTKDAARSVEPTGTNTLTGLAPMRRIKMMGAVTPRKMSICDQQTSVTTAVATCQQDKPRPRTSALKIQVYLLCPALVRAWKSEYSL